MFAQPVSWIMDIIRSLFASIDTLLLKFVRFILILIFDLANYTAPGELLEGIYSRLFVIIGVFMAFKLSFTFFHYVLEPDALTDNKQGVSKLFKNVIIMIVLLILLPNIFLGKIGGKGGKNMIVRIQNAAIPMLTRVLLNSDSDLSTDSINADTSYAMANEISVAIANAFIQPSIEVPKYCTKYKRGPDDLVELKTLDDIEGVATLPCTIPGSGVLGTNLFSDKMYIWSYSYFLPAISAILLSYILIKMVIVVGKRVFKIIILEIVTPIPVMSLIDPQALDKGDSPFNIWVHTFISTFLELFIQLGSLFLFIVFINMIIKTSTEPSVNFPHNEAGVNAFARQALLNVALILSLLFFAGEAPGFIKKALGIKDNGKDDMGAVMGAALGGFAAGALGGVQGGASGLLQGAMHGDALGGMVQGASAGYQAGQKTKPGERSHAWRVGGDSAAQLITGNKNYRTGLAGFTQRSLGFSRGFNVNNLNRLKGRRDQDSAAVGKAQEELDHAKMWAQQALDNGADIDDAIRDPSGNLIEDANGNAYTWRSYLSEKQATLSAAQITAEKSKGDYDTLKSTMEAKGISTRSTVWSERAGEHINNARYRATRSAVEHPDTAAGMAGRWVQKRGTTAVMGDSKRNPTGKPQLDSQGHAQFDPKTGRIIREQDKNAKF